MSSQPPQFGDFASCDSVPIGFEKVYTGQTDLSDVDTSDTDLTYSADADGNVMMQYSLWGFAYTTEDKWTDEIRCHQPDAGRARTTGCRHAAHSCPHRQPCAVRQRLPSDGG